MFGLTPSHRYYLYQGAADMRTGFDGLSGLVLAAMGGDPHASSVYLLVNRRRDKMKLLVWDSTGVTLYSKRLERGTFELPSGKEVHMTWETLMLMLAGISLHKISRKKRYVRA